MAALTTTIQAAAEQSGTPFVIAIDGQSGAGKSTLARKLAQILPASIIEGDDFYAGGTDLVPGPPSHLADVCINWRRLRATLETLRLGRPASFAPFDWEAFTGALSPLPKTIAPNPILLLEGVYAARPELRDLLDMTLCLTLPDALRHARLIAREGQITPWEQQWHRAEDWYFANRFRPEDADLIIDGTTL